MARILFIDDDILTLETYEKIASYFGHEAFLADSGAKAIKMARKNSVDLILLDRQLQDMDGFQILKEIRNMDVPLEVPVVMVSASHSGFADRAVAEGAQEFLSKPLLTDDLLELVEKYTSG
ncbi:MAG: response regulator [Anaerolineales bacterium]|nr:response regulator [Chloroflexota bacterium]MBL6979551.1 response regulator [Anaerolineales bacterium]